MYRRKIITWTFILNLTTLLGTIYLSYLLITKGLQLTSQPIKVLLFLTLHATTIYGLYISANSKIKPLVAYYLVVIVTPIIVTLGAVYSDNGIIPLYYGGQILSSTFGDNEELISKDNLYVKNSSSFLSAQWFDLYKDQGVFEKKLGRFHLTGDLNFTDFKVYDSIKKRYICLKDSMQTTQIVELLP